MVDELVTTLSLNEDQITEITDLYFIHFAEAKELMEKHKGDRENHRNAMDALRQDFDNQIKELLNDEQTEEFEEFIKNQKPRRGQQRPRRK